MHNLNVERDEFEYNYKHTSTSWQRIHQEVYWEVRRIQKIYLQHNRDAYK